MNLFSWTDKKGPASFLPWCVLDNINEQKKRAFRDCSSEKLKVTQGDLKEKRQGVPVVSALECYRSWSICLWWWSTSATIRWGYVLNWSIEHPSYIVKTLKTLGVFPRNKFGKLINGHHFRNVHDGANWFLNLKLLYKTKWFHKTMLSGWWRWSATIVCQ